MFLYASPFCGDDGKREAFDSQLSNSLGSAFANLEGAKMYLCGSHRWHGGYVDHCCREPSTYAVKVRGPKQIRELFAALRRALQEYCGWEVRHCRPTLEEREELALRAWAEGAAHHAVRIDFALRRV